MLSWLDRGHDQDDEFNLMERVYGIHSSKPNPEQENVSKGSGI